MTNQHALHELLGRIGANNGMPVYISEQELMEWPTDILFAIKGNGLITRSPPASHTICRGCENACFMPINTLAKKMGAIKTFIVCDKRDDINRVDVPLSDIEQWQASGTTLAKLISNLLKLPLSDSHSSTPNQWGIGLFRASKYSSHITMHANSKLYLLAGGHQLDVIELLQFVDGEIKLDQQRISLAVNKPAIVTQHGELPNDRAKRIKNRKIELERRGCRKPIKIIAEEEGLSSGRIHQILKKKEYSVKQAIERKIKSRD